MFFRMSTNPSSDQTLMLQPTCFGEPAAVACLERSEWGVKPGERLPSVMAGDPVASPTLLRAGCHVSSRLHPLQRLQVAGGHMPYAYGQDCFRAPIPKTL